MKPTDPSRFTPEDLESLREASVAGAQHAGQAMSQLTGLALRFSVPTVRALPIDDVPALLGGDEAPVVALYLPIYGDGRGNILIAMTPDAAGRLLDALCPGRPPGPPAAPDRMPPLEQSGLLETGNILAAAYLTAVSRHVRLNLIPSLPHLAVDMAGSVVDYLLVEMTRGQDAALVIDTQLMQAGGDGRLSARLLMLPDPDTLPEVLAALRSRRV